MKLISNRIRSPQSEASKASRADNSEQLTGMPQPPSPGVGSAQGSAPEQGGHIPSEPRHEDRTPPTRGEGLPVSDGVLGRTIPAPDAATAPRNEPISSDSSGSSDTPPPEATPPAVSGHTVASEPGMHHEVTWLMLRLLAAHGKVKAADGSDVVVTFIGEEPPLGDVFQIEATSPDMEQRNMTVVVLANEKSIEVLGGQEVIQIDSAPFQIHRQPITTSQEVAEAMFDLVEIELRRMGQILLDAVRDVWQNGGEEEQG